MSFHDNLYKSLVYHARSVIPSGVAVQEGESYGVRQLDPKAKAPSVTITVRDMDTSGFELGSVGSSSRIVYTVAAKSRAQRDAIKDLLYSGILHVPAIMYTDFSGSTPSNSVPGEFGDYVKITDVPMFETDRERLFWTAVVFVEYHVL
jgi:hypothetical protein